MRISKKNHFKITLSLLVCAVFISFLIFFSKPGNLRTALDDLLILLNQPYIIKKDTSSIQTKDLKKIIYNIFNSIVKRNENHNFKTIKIEISFKNYLALMKNRMEGINTSKNHNFLDQKKKVKGFIYFEEKKIPIRIRLKGDRADHWLSKKRFSLQVELVGNNSILGYKNFSLTNHLSSQYPENVLISRSLKRLNTFQYEFETLNVKFNGKNWGLMLLREDISPNYFEARKIKETPIARLTNEEDRRILSKTVSPYINESEIYHYTRNQSIYEVDFQKQKKYLLNENSANIISFIKSFHIENIKYNNKKDFVINYFDIDKFAKLFAYAVVFKDLHNTFFTNIKFYYNPYTSKISPISNDYSIGYFKNFENNYYFDELEVFLKKYSNKLYINLFNNDLFHKNFFESVNYLSKDIETIKKDLVELCYNFVDCNNTIDFNKIEKNIIKILNNEQKIIDIFNKISTSKNEDIFKHVNFPKINIQPSKRHIIEEKVINNLRNFIFPRFFDNGKFNLTNLTEFDIILKKITFFDDQNNQIKCLNKKFNKISLKNFENYSGKLDLNQNCIYKRYKIYGDVSNRNIQKKFVQSGFLEINNLQDLQETKFKKFESNIITLNGRREILRPIIIKENQELYIESNTTLKFDKDAFIFVDGGKLFCLGNKDNFTLLTSNKDKYWRGIFVRNSDNATLKNCLIKNTNEFRSYSFPFFSLTGGVNFYNSKVNLNNLKIENSFAEDGINFINSNVIGDKIEIINTKSDGIDFDFSHGIIKDIYIKNIFGDGLDFSGSNFNLENLKISDVGDKGISVGENTIIKANNVHISDSIIAVAVKDASKIVISNGIMISNENDFAAYNKKSFYKIGGDINLKNVKFDINKTQISKDSSILYE